MTQTSVPQPLVPSEVQNPDLPVELMPRALEQIQGPASAAVTVPPPSFELRDDQYYADHWGINE